MNTRHWVPPEGQKPVPMLSLREAAARGIERVYQPNWVGEMDHFKIDILPGGELGPWIRFYSPKNKAINGRDPVEMLWALGAINVEANGGYAYTGPLPDSEEYKAAEQAFSKECNRLMSV